MPTLNFFENLTLISVTASLLELKEKAKAIGIKKMPPNFASLLNPRTTPVKKIKQNQTKRVRYDQKVSLCVACSIAGTDGIFFNFQNFHLFIIVWFYFIGLCLNLARIASLVLIVFSRPFHSIFFNI